MLIIVLQCYVRCLLFNCMFVLMGVVSGLVMVLVMQLVCVDEGDIIVQCDVIFCVVY